MNPEDREKTSDDFTKERKKCMALVASYSVGSIGLNWQHLCHRVHLIEPPSSEPCGVQAIGRVRRFGNPSEVVYVYEYYGKDTFNDRLVQLNIRKVLPSIMTELDRRTFSGATTESSAAPRDDDEVEIDLGRWVLHKDKLYSEREYELDPNSKFLTPEELLAVIVRLMKGERITVG